VWAFSENLGFSEPCRVRDGDIIIISTGTLTAVTNLWECFVSVYWFLFSTDCFYFIMIPAPAVRVHCVEICSRLQLMQVFSIDYCLSVSVTDDWKLKTTPVVKLERPSEAFVDFLCCAIEIWFSDFFAAENRGFNVCGTVQLLPVISEWAIPW